MRPMIVSTGAEIIAPTGIRSPDRPTRSVVAIPATLSRYIICTQMSCLFGCLHKSRSFLYGFFHKYLRF